MGSSTLALPQHHTMLSLIIFTLVAAASAAPQIVPYVHEEIPAEPYVHQEIEALPYVHRVRCWTCRGRSLDRSLHQQPRRRRALQAVIGEGRGRVPGGIGLRV